MTELDKLANELCELADTLHANGWPVGIKNIRKALNEAYRLGCKSSVKELSAALNKTAAEKVIFNAFKLGRESVQNELAAEFMCGTSLRDPSEMLRDPSAVVDIARNSELRDAAIAAQECGDMKTAAALNMISQTPIGDKPDDDACLYGGWWA